MIKRFRARVDSSARNCNAALLAARTLEGERFPMKHERGMFDATRRIMTKALGTTAPRFSTAS